MHASMTPRPHADVPAIMAMPERYRQQKTTVTALEVELAATKAQLDAALGADEVCTVDGLGELRRVAASQNITWNTKKLNVIIASLHLVGDDKLAGQIEEAREVTPRAGYLMVKVR
jgi:hypothetical protein